MATEVKRQTDECLYEKSKLDSIESDFTQRYTKKISDIDKQFKNILNALTKRQNDVKQWREQEYNEGINHINRNNSILDKRLNELQRNPNDETLCRVPKLKDIYLSPFTLTSLQIQNITNMIFQLGETYQQNVKNRTFISFKMNENPQNSAMKIRTRITPEDKRKFLKRTVTERHKLDLNQSAFGKGKIYKDIDRRKGKTYGNNASNKVQSNGTKTLQYDAAAADQHQNAVRGFDIGNNAKYAAAQEMAQHTNALPEDFWDAAHDSDSDESQAARQQLIAKRWKTERSNINKESNRNVLNKRAATQRGRYVYNNETSSEEDDNETNDGFEKYVAPKHKAPTNKKHKQHKKRANYKQNNTRWIVHERGLQHKYDTMWFQVAKMRNGKANSAQMKKHLDSSGLSKKALKQIWSLSDLDKDGNMGNDEFVLCMFLIDQVRDGYKLPHVLPPNYIPPTFRGRKLMKTPPRKAVHISRGSGPTTMIFEGHNTNMRSHFDAPEHLRLTPSKSSPQPSTKNAKIMNSSTHRAHAHLPKLQTYQQTKYGHEKRHKLKEDQDPVSLLSVSKEVHQSLSRK